MPLRSGAFTLLRSLCPSQHILSVSAITIFFFILPRKRRLSMDFRINFGQCKSISSALRMVFSVILAPPISRAISAFRPSRSKGTTLV